MPPIIPPKLRIGSRVRIISPSRSLVAINSTYQEKKNIEFAFQSLNNLGLKVEISNSSNCINENQSASIEDRLRDLHSAFIDDKVDAIMTSIGGFNANQLLPYIDYQLISENPKIFCGYSDISVISGALLKQSNLVSYSGPHFSTFGMNYGLEYTINEFKKALFSNLSWRIKPSNLWSEDSWFSNQEDRKFNQNNGYISLQTGVAEGQIIAGNLTSLHLLQGTQFMPSLEDSILFVEDLRDISEVDRVLESILQTRNGSLIKGLVLGRFPTSSGATIKKLKSLISKENLKNKPIIYGLDIGHTTPHTTIPFGGYARINSSINEVKIDILKH
tara:strand:+ start:1461 stop:2453 length:993 start_codon:yes stop_codon:yes gene_type:complete